MRIISGRLGGRQFDSTRGHKTHPMAEKIRGGLFAVLGDIKGMSVLDLFAGSGALGLEAISRGAKRVVFIEKDKQAYAVITHNIVYLGLSEASQLFKMSALAWLKRHRNEMFNLILCDPPFGDLNYESIEVAERNLKKGGILVLSWPLNRELPRFKELRALRNKTYGDAQLIFYR